MFSVKGGNIYHIRGDTGVLLFQPTDETGKDVADFTATLSVKKTSMQTTISCRRLA